MRITIVTRNMLAGGSERVIAQLLKEWTQQKIICDLILIDKTSHFYEIPKEISIHEIGQCSEKPLINKIKQYVKVRKIIRKINPDIVLSLPEEIGIYVIGALFGTRIPVVVSERNNPWVMPNKKITRALRKILYPFAKGIIFQTEQATKYFPNYIIKKSIVIMNPLDISRIPEPYEGIRSNILVGAGRLVPQKNFYLLIDAFEGFYEMHKDYKLIIYGEGKLRRELEEYSKKLPKGTVIFSGVSNSLLEDMKNAAAFVLSSDFEGVPNVLIEAMAMGMPVIATDYYPGGVSTLIQDGKNGIIVPVGSIHDMEKAMEKISDDSDFAVSIGREAVKIREKVDSKIISKEWLNYLRECR